MQCASSEHDVRQLVAPHTNGSQGRVIASRHAPAPLHVSATVSVEPVQLAGAQTAPLGCRAHAPAPSHVPLVPHVATADATHSPSGSVSVVEGWQSPSVAPVAAARHDMHGPPHAESQHTPSAMRPLEQCEATVDGAPSARSGTHAPVATLQNRAPLQAASSTQLPAHTGPSQPIVHAVVPADAHVPAALHVGGSVCTPAAHDDGPQTVPTG